MQNPASFKTCPRCRRTAYIRRGLCARCLADDLIGNLLPQELIKNDERLLNIKRSLEAADPELIIKNITRAKSASILSEMIREPGALTHEWLDQRGSRTATRTVRALLVENGALPRRDEQVAHLELWINLEAAALNPAQARVFSSFARWRHLRYLRGLQEPATYGQVRSRKNELGTVLKFFEWSLVEYENLTDLTQADIDRWLTTGPANRYRIRPFLDWAHTNRYCGRFEVVPRANTELDIMGIGEEERWRLLTAVFQDGPDPAARLAAALILLYGVNVLQLTRLRLEDVNIATTGPTLRFGVDPLELLPELSSLTATVIAERTASRMLSQVRDATWLFPGTLPGQPLSVDALTGRILKLGVKPRRARSSALASLAQVVPSPVLARLIGLSYTTTAKWSDAVSASDSKYAGLRPMEFSPK